MNRYALHCISVPLLKEPFYDHGSLQAQTVREAWNQVDIRVACVVVLALLPRSRRASPGHDTLVSAVSRLLEDSMRVQFQSEGGLAVFPGLQKLISIDVDALPASDANRLRQLVRAASFFDLPAHIGTPPRGAADMREYTLTIEDGGRRHTVRVAEPITDATLQELVDALQTQARTLRGPTP